MPVLAICRGGRRTIDFSNICERRILYFDPRLEESLEQAADAFRRLDPQLRDVDGVVFRTGRNGRGLLSDDRALRGALRGAPAAILSVETGDEERASTPSHFWKNAVVIAMDRMVKRYPGTIVSRFLGRESTHLRFPPLAPPALRPVGGRDLVPVFRDVAPGDWRQVDIQLLLQHGGAVLAEHHYVLPSGQHADKFVRLARALRSQANLLRVADWILPFVTGKSVVIVDTGTILSLALAVQREYYRLTGNLLHVSAFPSYHLSFDEATDIIGTTIQQGAGADHVLYVLSVNSTGQKARQLLAWTPSHCTATVVAVVDTGDGDALSIQALSRIPITRWQPDGVDSQCGECRRHSFGPVAIEPETYERLPYQRKSRRPVSPPKPEDYPQLMWEAADCTHAVKLHHDVAYDSSVPRAQPGVGSSRHFHVYIDVAAMLSHDRYRAHCKDKMSALALPDLILAPEHGATKTLRELAEEVWPDIHFCSVDSARLEPSVEDAVEHSKRVLLLDDALVSGATLTGMRNEVFRVRGERKTVGLMQAFVVLARPFDRRTVATMMQLLRHPDGSGQNFFAADSVLLPKTGRFGFCPWCSEHDLLTRRLSYLTGAAYVAARRRIGTIESGLNAPLYVSAPDRQLSGSFFGPLHIRTAYAAACSVARQRESELKGPPDHHTQEILDLPKAAASYIDAVLLAALLRSCEAHTTRDAQTDPESERILRSLNARKLAPGCVEEIALAALQGKFALQPVLDLIAAAGETLSYRALFRDLIKLELGDLPQNPSIA